MITDTGKDKADGFYLFLKREIESKGLEMNRENLEMALFKRRRTFGKELKKIPEKRVRKVQEVEELNEIGTAATDRITVGYDKRTFIWKYK